MLKLFQSIFEGGERQARYPESLIEAAIERAVDGTDPRLRAVAGYRKKLRAPVIHAIDHVVGLVDELEAPLALSRACRATHPELIAYFASFEHIQEVLTFDLTLSQWLKSAEAIGADHIVMLLLMEKQERQVLGIALEGDMLRRDVPQETVAFAHHRLVDPTGSESETRRLLKRRAFDHLLSLALERMTATHGERRELEQERNLLRRKRAALASGHWGFDEAGGQQPSDPQVLEQHIEEIESQLAGLGAGTGLLKVHMDIVVDVLARSEEHFWSTRSTLFVDRMGLKQTEASARAPEIRLAVLHNAAGRTLVARLVDVARADLPPQRDLLREAQRYLG